MTTAIFGIFFVLLVFHAVQWHMQVKSLGGKPLWFKIFKG